MTPGQAAHLAAFAQAGPCSVPVPSAGLGGHAREHGPGIVRRAVRAGKARALAQPAVQAGMCWLARRRLWQVVAHLEVISGALPKWEAWAVIGGAALVPEPSPAGEVILVIMAAWLLVRRYRLMKVLWAAAVIEARYA